jgi:dienelactone hydrolase
LAALASWTLGMETPSVAAPNQAGKANDLATTYPISLPAIQDTYIDQRSSYDQMNFGADPEMQLRYGGIQRPLIQFDVDIIPPDAQIIKAELKFYVTYQAYGDTDTSLGTSVYQLTRDWKQDEATWYQATDENTWATAGAEAIPLDRLPSPITTLLLEPSDRNQYVRYDVTQAVQDWVNDPSSNKGLLLQGGPANPRPTGYYLTSSDSSIRERRPRLEVTYEGDAPLHTPTPTSTPTLTPTPEDYTVITSSLMSGCIGAGPDADRFGYAPSGQVLLFWEGQPWSAELLMDVDSAQCDHSVYINDTEIGKTKASGGSYCSGGRVQEWSFDPEILNSGWNRVRIAADGECWENGWTATNIRIRLYGQVVAPQVLDVKYGERAPHELMAKLQLPVDYSPHEPVPLLVALHGWGEPAASSANALNYYAMAANERGWLLATPRILGEHSASVTIQRDMIKLINYLKNHYAVDSDRVYITGISMGGGIAATVAAKYPHVFAAVAEEQGPTDLAAWYHQGTNGGLYRNVLYSEINGSPDTKPFVYEKRSSRQLASNLQHVPVCITHGASDNVVPVSHGRSFYDALKSYGAYNVEYHEYEGTHGQAFPGDDTLAGSPEGILDFLGRYRRPAEPPTELHIRNDEEHKDYYWLTIEQLLDGWAGVSPHWTEVDARYDPNTGSIWADVFDDVNVYWKTNPPWYKVRLTFDLVKMGLDPDATYTIEVYQDESGEFRHETSYGPRPDGRLAVIMEGRNDPRHFHVQITSGDMVAPFDVIYQQGMNEYSGCTDTFMKEWEATAIKGDESYFSVDSGDQSALLRFDLSDLPQPILIHAAYLYLTTGWGSEELDINMYRVLRHWEEMEANWIHARDGVEWAGPGCTDIETDYLGVVSASKRITSPNTEYRFNVRNLVEYWVNHPGENHGLLLQGAGSGSYQFASSENPSVNSRPKLEIIYIVATPSPTPTQTDTPTQTPTVTPTGTDPANPPATPTATSTWTPTVSASPTATNNWTPTITPTPTQTGTPTWTPTPTISDHTVVVTVYEQMRSGFRVPMENVEIRLDRGNATIARGSTNVHGKCFFSDLDDGQYFVVASLPPGYANTSGLGAAGIIPPAMRVTFVMQRVDGPTATPTDTPSLSPTMTPTATETVSATAPPSVTPTGTASSTPEFGWPVHLPILGN